MSEETKDHLLSSHKVLKRLGLRADDKAWRAIRKVLIADYGMANVGGGGFRIRESQFEKFLQDNYV